MFEITRDKEQPEMFVVENAAVLERFEFKVVLSGKWRTVDPVLMTYQRLKRTPSKTFPMVATEFYRRARSVSNPAPYQAEEARHALLKYLQAQLDTENIAKPVTALSKAPG